MFAVAVRQLQAKSLRAGLTVLGFGFCVNLYIVVTTVMHFITDDLDRQVQRFAGLLMVQSRSRPGMSGIEWPPISSTVPLRVAQRILQSARVDAAASTAVTFAALAPPPFPTAPPEALLVGVTPGKEQVFLKDAAAFLGSNRLRLHGGITPVILGMLAARHFAADAGETMQVPTPVGPIDLAAVGSRIRVRGREFEVQGILDPETNQVLRSCVVVPLDAAQDLLGRAGTVSGILLTPLHAADLSPIEEEIESAHPTLMVVTEDKLRHNVAQLLQRVRQLFAVVRATSVAVSALLITIVMFVAVLERTKEIGTLRAIGAPARAIFALILWESAIISGAGAAIGVPISRRVILRALGADAAGIRKRRIEAEAVALLGGLGIVAALLPAARAVRVDPIVALRYD